MATEVLMPKQGNSVESCIILDWKKKEGDSISVGEIICEAETDKSTIEVESTAEGTILKLLYAVGEEVPVQSPMMIVGEPGEKVESSASSAVAEVESTTQAPAPAPEKSQVIEKSTEKSTEKTTESTIQGVSPRARSLGSSTGIAVNELVGSGPKGRVIERDVVSALASREPLSPAALETMVAQGLQAPSKGSGMGGRILIADLVKDASKGDAPVQVASTGVLSPASVVDFPGAFTETVVKGVRKITAKRMHESIATTAQFTLNSFANASAMKRLRERFKNSDPRLGLQKITINDLVLFAVSRTILQFPYVNSHFLGDRMLTFEHVHLGCAVDTPKGLLVPVIKYADTMSLSQISATFKGLSSAAVEGKASPDDLSGSTFTVTNLGSMGVETFTPVLNVPEVAILGVGGISLRPVEDEDEDIAFIPHIGLSLTIDHQGVDGAPGARFLKALGENIAAIDLLLAL